jgi:hypothetical protein
MTTHHHATAVKFGPHRAGVQYMLVLDMVEMTIPLYIAHRLFLALSRQTADEADATPPTATELDGERTGSLTMVGLLQVHAARHALDTAASLTRLGDAGLWCAPAARRSPALSRCR